MKGARLGPRGLGAAALAAAMTAAGILAPAGSALLSAGLGLYAFLLVYGVLHQARGLAAARLKVERVIEGPGVEGEPHAVKLRVCNFSPLALELLEARDAPPPGTGPAGEKTALMVPPRGCAEAGYAVRPRLGRHRWGRLRLRVRDPLGFYRSVEAAVEASGMSELLAAASVGEARAKLRRLLAAYSAAGLAPARAAGGTVFLELREYREGDDPRLIDWKASARRGKLLVKVMEAEALARLLVVLHVPPWSLERPGPGAEAPAEATARLAAGIAAAAAEAGAEAVMAAWGPGGGGATPPLRGPAAVGYAARLAAAAVSEGGDDPEEALLRLLERLTRRRPYAAVLATPGPLPRRLAAALSGVSSRLLVATAEPETVEARRLWERRGLPGLQGAGLRLIVAGRGGRLGPREAEALARLLTL